MFSPVKGQLSCHSLLCGRHLSHFTKGSHMSASGMSSATDTTEDKARTTGLFTSYRYHIAAHKDAHKIALFLFTLRPISILHTPLPSIGYILEHDSDTHKHQTNRMLICLSFLYIKWPDGIARCDIIGVKFLRPCMQVVS